MSGAVSYHAGLSAEDQVTRRYVRDGHVILSRRWRSKAGEIDLVAEKDGTVVFVEVKKSRSHSRAVEHLSQRQLSRIFRSAEDFIGYLPAGAHTDCRVDVALLDHQGQIDILPNVLCA
ncbi:YraN family protein [Nioella aestuarii]|uniref:YraN family protein n=1 Tax=Nioella aestuarii TaxID=1662864 RepID=UPI003D7FE836